MKRSILWVCTLFFVTNLFAQKKFDIYNATENAEVAIKAATTKAAKENKHVLVQIGGNWCSWCAKFHKFTTENEQVGALLTSSFIVYHLNYSKENRNLSVLAKYLFPQRFGFPVFLVLDSNGKLLHTQNSAYLEDGAGYSKEKVMEFLSAWTVDALNPEKYK